MSRDDLDRRLPMMRLPVVGLMLTWCLIATASVSGGACDPQASRPRPIGSSRPPSAASDRPALSSHDGLSRAAAPSGPSTRPPSRSVVDADEGSEAKAALERIKIGKGLCVVLGLPNADQPEFVTELAAGSALVIYFQSPDAGQVSAVRMAEEKAGFLGHRVFADQGHGRRIQLADNMAGAILVSPASRVEEQELLRVLHPEGKAWLTDKVITKPFPEGIDTWSHPRHGPDNNPAWCDQVARAPYLTQFTAKPMFSTQPTLTVAAAGRVFKTFGPQSRAEQSVPMSNTLMAINGYNGILLWTRKLRPGFMVHRHTMIATSEYSLSWRRSVLQDVGCQNGRTPRPDHPG